ncbi:hypothetical protein BD626DRAFT_492844 [Schizophyllum amplum]|uniref:F-box domain-containing protein n=1 Tax=Schizophyllum amplum TaxID=97359 RepID=A0A550CGL7_9AGAR|nr:hypothetical protein BD626DRAFT_492844 [Auriculariopsis ampla]
MASCSLSRQRLLGFWQTRALSSLIRHQSPMDHTAGDASLSCTESPLPPELVFEILKHLVDAYIDDWRSHAHSSQLAAAKIGSICAAWSAMMWGTEAWATIVFPGFGSDQHLASYLNACVARSGDHPLRIVIRGGAEEPHLPLTTVLSQLLPHSARWGELTIDGSFDDLCALSASRRSFPQLQKVHLEAGKFTKHSPDLLNFLATAPRLSNIYLATWSYHHSYKLILPPLRNVARLSLGADQCHSPDDIVDAVSQYGTTLENLEVNFDHSDMTVANRISGEPVFMAALKRVLLFHAANALLMRIVAPNIEQMTLVGLGVGHGQNASPYAPLLLFVAFAAPHALRSLWLDGVVHEFDEDCSRDVLRCLEQMDNLDERLSWMRVSQTFWKGSRFFVLFVRPQIRGAEAYQHNARYHALLAMLRSRTKVRVVRGRTVVALEDFQSDINIPEMQKTGQHRYTIASLI